MAATPLQAPTMHSPKGIIALDLDGTLLNSQKELSEINRAALEHAAAAGYAIVPTTGRFYGGMPQFIRDLPFIRYAITINGAAVADLQGGTTLYRAEIPCQQAVEIMSFLDAFPVIYDCYQDNDAWMTEAQKEKIDIMISSPHYRKMFHDLRKPVPELKETLLQRKRGVQKIQLCTNQPQLRLDLMQDIPKRFENLSVTSSISDNIEINQINANKGEALIALAVHLGVPRDATFAFGDGLNDLSMLRDAGVGIAMANACDEAKALAAWIAPSCDEDGVAAGIKNFCF